MAMLILYDSIVNVAPFRNKQFLLRLRGIAIHVSRTADKFYIVEIPVGDDCFQPVELLKLWAALLVGVMPPNEFLGEDINKLLVTLLLDRFDSQLFFFRREGARENCF